MIDCDNVENFIREHERMCESLKCENCELSSCNNYNGKACDVYCKEYPEKAIAIVRSWSHKHPIGGQRMKHQTARFIAALLALSALVALLTTARAAGVWTERQQIAHQIAELARSLELAEDDPIIIRAKELWAADAQTFTEREIEMIATTMYYEAGNGCTEEHQLLVGRVLLNRVADGRFGGNTVYDCLVAPRQYSSAYTGALKIPADRREEMMALARRAAAGEPKDCPGDVLYQDNLPHGTGTYKSFYSKLLGSTTYFCYG